MTGEPAGQRAFAAVALASLTALATGLCWWIYDSRGIVLAVGLAAGLGVAATAALGWWAFTTSRAWKRRLNVALAGCVIAAVVVATAGIGLTYAVAVLAVAALAGAYVATARRAIGPAVAWAATAARPISHPWLLVNPRSGDGAAGRIGLEPAARARGIEVRVLQPGDDPVALATEAVAKGADAIGVSGGDGSLGAVAGAAVRLGVPFFCVPTGTRNHFARDVGLRRDAPLDALDALSGVERRVDIGTVSGRVFLNNVSLGAYAAMVHEPEYRGDKLATAHSVLTPALRGEAEPVPMAFLDGSGHPHDGAFVLLVANNEYELRSVRNFGSRARLDGRTLQVSVLQATTGAKLAGVLLSRADDSEWAQWTTEAFSVAAGATLIPAAIDGEAVTLESPAVFRVLPGALRVLAPTRAGPGLGASRAFHPATVRSLWRIAAGRAP
ncbi:MAG: hypothetical protein QOJ50_2350 [Cryptosporangiaceae bacterium]|nr:hypothetical protein [Cryptosporangiaceae bacterium]